MTNRPARLTAIIADDEPVLRFHLNKLLGDLAPTMDIVGMASNGEDALALVRTQQPDVVFLDIKMPGLSGLDVAATMQREGLSTQCSVVFLTAYDQYAVAAFEREAVDYLLKPVDEQRLEKTLDRLSGRAAGKSPATLDITTLETLLRRHVSNDEQPLRWINAQRGDDIHVISVDDVLLFKAEDKYTTVVTGQGEYLIRRSLKQLEESLSADQFWRVHRNTLVRVAAIERVSRSLTGQCRIELKQAAGSVPVSRRFADRFKQM